MVARTTASDPNAPTVAGWAAAASGDFQRAEALFRAALREVPGDAAAMTGLACIYRQQGRLRDALQQCDAALKIAPHYAPPWLERAHVLASGGAAEAAAASYAHAAELEPDNVAALAGVAGLAARAGDAARARAFADRALAIAPDHLAATCAIASADLADSDFVSADARLRARLAAERRANDETAMAFNLWGDALDRLGRVTEAFGAYARAKDLLAQAHAHRFQPHHVSHTRFVGEIDAALSRTEPASWVVSRAARGSPGEGGEPAVHVFLVGYPRSGTTLVENILASLPNSIAIEERPTLREADEAFLGPADGMVRLAALDEVAADRFRAAYWERVRRTGVTVAGRIFIDMDPLKSIRLPLIARLFPDAKVVVMRRDPRDVVWSCFRTMLAPTASSIEYSTLERAAHHYAAVMRLIERCRSVLPIAIHELHYEQLVSGFDDTTRALCTFLGVGWTDRLRGFDTTAKARAVTTASAAQVRRPLFDGRRQWERYRTPMAEVSPILAPWVARLGYEA